MTVEKPGFSRRRLLTTAAVGVPAVGLLGAVNLFNAPAAKAAEQFYCYNLSFYPKFA